MEKEGGIQAAILHYLQYLENMKDLLFIRNNSFSGYIHRRNGSKGYIKNNKPGSSDIFLCIKGKAIFLEVKAPKRKQTDNQKDFEELVNSVQGYYYVVHSVEEVEKIISKHLL